MSAPFDGLDLDQTNIILNPLGACVPLVPNAEHASCRSPRMQLSLVHAEDVPDGWFAVFEGGLELEVRVAGDERWAYWSLPDGTPLGFTGWANA